MKWILVIVMGLALGFCLGCRQPVRTHKFTTKINDVWAAQPTQEITYSMEWTQ
jgi:hypothetical protein